MVPADRADMAAQLDTTSRPLGPTRLTALLAALALASAPLNCRAAREEPASARKLDQIEVAECVDERFHQELLRDLERVQLDRRVDSFQTYHDGQFARMIAALLATPDAGDPGGAGAAKLRPLGDVLEQVRRFWRQTLDTHAEGARQVAQLANQTARRTARALQNRRYLLARVEGLKVMLFAGEEAILALNGRVKRLQLAMGEQEMQSALCSCVASRGGRSALMLVNEFLLERPANASLEAADTKARAAARDVAQFCSYWYGDTLRALVKHKEQQIRQLVQTVAAYLAGGAQTGALSAEARRALASSERAVDSLIGMTQRWLPRLAAWIRRTLGAARRSRRSPTSTTTGAPSTTTGTPSTTAGTSEASFEQRLTARTHECAAAGFRELLALAEQQGALMYPSAAREPPPAQAAYVGRLRAAYLAAFGPLWAQMRDHWARNLSRGDHYVIEDAELEEPAGNPQQARPLDEQLDASLELSGSAYERGARLGLALGAFVGARAARNWPDPLQLNTFAYDSLVMAGVALGHSVAETRLLERRIVRETAKRLAFSAANERAFERTLSSAYLSGAYLAPRWGLLHGQRVAAKRAARIGARVGAEAAVSAVGAFVPQAAEFLASHEHQRALAAPYAPARRRRDAGRPSVAPQGEPKPAAEPEKQAQDDGQLRGSVQRAALECGERSGALMGALMGLAVVPEAFEGYARSRGSLEALENEFNQFKLGALRAYRLAHSWAYLNATAGLPEEPASGHSKSHNVLQHMVTNYDGARASISQHSRAQMLRLRQTAIDRRLLLDIQRQANDLVEPAEQPPVGDLVGSYERPKLAGALAGRLSLLSGGAIDGLRARRRAQPIRLQVIDLGASLAMLPADAPDAANATGGAASLAARLARVHKLFLKFDAQRPSRRTKKDEREEEGARREEADVAHYLNVAQRALGEGYLAGTFSHSQQPAEGDWWGSTAAEQQEDPFGAESALLNELARQIELAPNGKPIVGLVESVMNSQLPSAAQVSADGAK